MYTTVHSLYVYYGTQSLCILRYTVFMYNTIPFINVHVRYGGSCSCIIYSFESLMSELFNGPWHYVDTISGLCW